MKLHALLRAGALCAAVLITAGCSAAAVFAEEESSEAGQEKVTAVSGDYTYSVLYNEDDEDEKAACIEKYEGTDTDLVIPAELDGLPVVQLGDRAFVGNGSLKSVKLPEFLTGIGKYAFAECVNIERYEVDADNPFLNSRDGVLYSDGGMLLLRYPIGTDPTDVTLEEGLVGIGSSAFTCCRTLRSVKFPSTLEYIGNSAFAECIDLRAVETPESLTEIADFAFNGCTRLSDVKLNEGLQTIGAGAFTNAPIESLTLPSTLTSVGEQAFCNTQLKEITIPPSVTNVGATSFGWSYHSALEELIADENFIVRGRKGSDAERYATDTDEGNNFKFEEAEFDTPETSDSSEDDSSKAEEPQSADSADESDEGGSKTVKIIGLSCCGVLLALIAVIALRSGKKEPEKQQTSEKKPENQTKTADEEEEDA
ncbi:MAG: leucine-rich repeat domain-containing protein [Oscillospiraceae bacterium]|nr:leucine-rich repeat domain-containing protein [Oscillospiraceae bacterium]